MVFILITCFVFVAGCGQSTPTGLSLTGTVEHDFYSSLMGSMYFDSSMSEYFVHITATNSGPSVTYDAVQIYYDGGDGKGLSTTSVAMSDEKQQEVTLNTWQSDELRSHTNGYTYDILQHTKTGRVALHVTFIKDGQPIDSFHAVLPSIIEWNKKPAELPFGKEVPLTFTRDYDAVMKEVQNR